MHFLYYSIIFVSLALLLWEAVTIVRRNKKILIKGNDDIFLLMIILGILMFLLQPSKDAIMASAIASISVLLALLFQLAIKRGFSKEGFQKLFYCIPWEHIEEVQIEKENMSRIKVHVITNGGKRSLLFLYKDLQNIIRLIQKQSIRVYLDGELNV